MHDGSAERSRTYDEYRGRTSVSDDRYKSRSSAMENSHKSQPSTFNKDRSLDDKHRRRYLASDDKLHGSEVSDTQHLMASHRDRTVDDRYKSRSSAYDGSSRDRSSAFNDRYRSGSSAYDDSARGRSSAFDDRYKSGSSAYDDSSRGRPTAFDDRYKSRSDSSKTRTVTRSESPKARSSLADSHYSRSHDRRSARETHRYDEDIESDYSPKPYRDRKAGSTAASSGKRRRKGVVTANLSGTRYDVGRYLKVCCQNEWWPGSSEQRYTAFNWIAVRQVAEAFGFTTGKEDDPNR